ncbi:hypothetical protein [Metakosakonia massiliensis]|uniref:2-(5''-triphosphoribosyl)-3'-dephosphocoenzyme-A synthase n=1 Tax=Phytobacter massiliensis TaxID=1485952 RepID=A0A6N3E637_9ENTR
MLDTVTPDRAETPLDRAVLANNLHQALARIAHLSPSLNLLHIAPEDDNRAATVLLGSVYSAACDRLSHSLLLTQNQICDNALQQVKRIPAQAGDFPALVEIVRTLTLPVWSRLIRDGHTFNTAALQSLLHILAWRSDNHWLQDQAQRLLWQGGILGEGGEKALQRLDEAAASRGLSFPAASEILATTCFLSAFPAGPFVTDNEVIGCK